MRDSYGYTLVELLFVMGLVAVIVGATVPQVTVGMERARTRAAARYLATQMAFARTQAVGRAATTALRFQEGADGVRVSIVVDGNRNGVRTRDIDNGLDVDIQPPVRLEDLFPGVVIGAPANADETPLLLGGTGILSFTPSGTSTSGTVQVLGRDGSRFAVRVLGATGRVRLLQFDISSGTWIDSW
jgi:Tfp pilus assembly protein FimT